MPRKKLFFARVLIATGLVAPIPAIGLDVLPVSANAGTKVTICHRTASTTNPYRRITVAQSSIKGGANSKHGNASGNHNAFSVTKYPSGFSTNNPPVPNVFDPAFNYPANDKKWGDIVPPTDVSGNVISGFSGLNYVGVGVDIYNGTNGKQGLCKKMTAAEYVQSELTAGQNITDIMAELNEQSANEDKALRDALGGSFIGATAAQMTSVGATTNVPTGVSTSGATLNGNLSTGVTAAATSFFWGVDSTCASGTSVAATPATVTGTGNVSANLTGLTAGNTYYYKVVGTTDAGLETEGTVEGSCVSFVAGQSAESPTLSGPGSSTGGATEPSLSGPGSSSDVTPSLPETGGSFDGGFIAAMFVVIGTALLLPIRRRDSWIFQKAPDRR